MRRLLADLAPISKYPGGSAVERFLPRALHNGILTMCPMQTSSDSQVVSLTHVS